MKKEFEKLNIKTILRNFEKVDNFLFQKIFYLKIDSQIKIFFEL